MKRLWIGFALVMVISFLVLGWIGTRIYQEKPPIPSKVVTTDGTVLVAEGEIAAGQNVWQSLGGIIDRLHEQHGSLIKEGDVLTTLSDNHVMWVYFNVPEARYLEYQLASRNDQEHQQIELVLANGSKFQHAATSLRIEAQFNNENGNIPFRADFPNPDRLLRHGMTGNILIHRTLPNALVIPQRATFEILDKQYVYVVGKDDVVHQREIRVQNELENIFVIKSGLEVDDRLVYEGIRQVHDGQKLEASDFVPPDQVIANQKFHAE